MPGNFIRTAVNRATALGLGNGADGLFYQTRIRNPGGTVNVLNLFLTFNVWATPASRQANPSNRHIRRCPTLALSPMVQILCCILRPIDPPSYLTTSAKEITIYANWRGVAHVRKVHHLVCLPLTAEMSHLGGLSLVDCDPPEGTSGPGALSALGFWHFGRG